MKKLISYLCAATLLGLSISAAFAGDVYDRVSQKGEIECGYSIWRPVTYKDPGNGDVKGVSREIMDAIGRKIDLKIDWEEEVAWEAVLDGLNDNRYDMICTPMEIMSPRTKVIDFSTPIFFLPIYIVTRANDTRFDKADPDLNSPSVKIGVLEGDSGYNIVIEKFPKATKVFLKTGSDYPLLLEELKNNKSDLVLVSAETFEAYNEKNPGALKIAAGGGPFSILRVGFGLPQWDRSFKSLIDSAIDNLQDEGTLDKILDKYDPKRNIFLRLTQPYKSPE